MVYIHGSFVQAFVWDESKQTSPIITSVYGHVCCCEPTKVVYSCQLMNQNGCSNLTGVHVHQVSHSRLATCIYFVRICENDIVVYTCILCINIEKADGTLTPVRSNPAVPVEMLKKVQDLLKGGISIEDIVDRLRTETVPKGCPCHPWRSGVYICVVCGNYVQWYMFVVCVLHVCLCMYMYIVCMCIVCLFATKVFYR